MGAVLGRTITPSAGDELLTYKMYLPSDNRVTLFCCQIKIRLVK